MKWRKNYFPTVLAISAAFSLSVVASGASAEGAVKRHATEVTVQEDEALGVTEVRVRFDAPPTYSARVDRGGLRVVLDVPGAAVLGAKPAIVDRTGLVSGVLTQSFGAGESATARVLVTLAQPASRLVRVEGNDLVMWLAVSPEKLEVKRAPRAPLAQAPEATRVLGVKFSHLADQDQVRIQLSGVPSYSLENGQAGRSRLVLHNTSLPAELQQTLDASAFGGQLKAVSTYEAAAPEKGVTLEAERQVSATSQVRLVGSALVWSFFRPGDVSSAVTGIAADGKEARRIRTLHVDAPASDLMQIHSTFSGIEGESSSPEQAGSLTPTVLGQADGGAGRRIDLDLKDADIHNVLRLLADVGRVNIVTADNVTGSVTIRMRNVPWKQALDVVLQAKALGMVERGNMVRVAPLADLEKEREMEVARRSQEVRLAPLETRLIPVSYATADDVQQRVSPLLSERGSVAVDGRTNILIVRDLSGNLDQIEQLTRELDTQTPQVLVEARIVEATSRYIKDVGIQWGGDLTFSPATANPTGLVFPNSVGIAGGASDGNTPTAGLSPFQSSVTNPNFAVNLPAAVGTGSGGALGLTFGSIDNTINLGLRLSAAESSGMLRILSSPRILTLDNNEARISQGTLIPFSQVSAQGVQTTFQEAKLQLLVTPHVTADGSVSMKVKINRDEPDFNQTSARGDPTVLKREAETELLVPDGHTAVIGGIYTRNSGRSADQVPFFGDIPLVGLLFQRRRASDQRQELVIFLTPRIVNRAQALGR
ncbi:MAG: type IV pilus secretin PilQ [Polyangiaceae bacterium]|nr:type IV pilus secretin PilQ [Polyangiaceae bacterium]